MLELIGFVFLIFIGVYFFLGAISGYVLLMSFRGNLKTPEALYILVFLLFSFLAFHSAYVHAPFEIVKVKQQNDQKL